jgi:competence protein ComEC
LLDVGTGLSVLVRGDDFNLLYDGGSNDDRALGPKNRLLAYLQRHLGRSGGPHCRPEGGEAPERALTHVVLSHPHRDHVSLLPDVVGCFAVAHAWEPGARSDGQAYRAFLTALSRERGLVYHTARPPAQSRRMRTRDDDFEMRAWRRVRELEVIPLGRAARATVLHARHEVHDLNDASLVLRLDLGKTSVLLTGDATGGERADPSAEPERGSVEGHLLSHHRPQLDVDVLQVAHHGSRTSSRTRFLDAVSPTWALVSSGPMQYGSVTLPDRDVIDELERRGVSVLRTDAEDERCATRDDKVGTPADGRPGGCNGATLRIEPSGVIELEAE